MPFWLMKSEPDELSIDDLARLGEARWDGVRNYQARNFLRQMQPGELFLFHHSSCASPGVAGIGRILRGAYPDPAADDPESPYHDPQGGSARWSAVDVGFVERFASPLPLPLLRQQAALADWALLRRGNRLSVMPVSEPQWHAVLGVR